MSKNQNSFYTIRNESTATKSVDILIYGNIPAWDEDNYKMKNSADQFVRDFQRLEKDYDRINIHINSPGGSLFHAFPIFNIIKASKKDIHTYNDGIAASAASVILMAGKKVHSAKNGMIMIHNASNIIWGNAMDLREAAVVLEKYDGVIADHYAKMLGKTKEETLAAYMDYKDHWLTADEALEEGLIHEIEDYESEDAPPANIANMAFEEVMNLYRKKEDGQDNFFTRMANRIRTAFHPSDNQVSGDTHLGDQDTRLGAEDSTHLGDPSTHSETPAPIAGADSPEPPTNSKPTMDFKNSLDILAKNQLSPEDITALKAEISAFTGVNEKFTPEEVQNRIDSALAPLNEQITNLTTEKTNLATQVQNLSSEKTALATEKATLSTQVTNLTTDIQAYRASGVKPTQPTGEKPDAIADSAEEVENFYSEADAEMAELRAQAGISKKK